MIDQKDFTFVQEKIKQRPYSRRKILRRMAITCTMAVLFGLVSCFTFLVLEPVFNNWIHPEEKAQTITLPKDEDEITLEDIVSSDEASAAQAEIERLEAELSQQTEMSRILEHQMLYGEMKQVVAQTQRCMVTIESVVSDVDWFDNLYEQKGKTSGFIVADNGKELIIIAQNTMIENPDHIRVTFYDGSQVDATIKAMDSTVQLVALAVPLSSLSSSTKEQIAIGVLGNSWSSNIMATPIIALGRPLGYQSSVVYGMVTSTNNLLEVVDANYSFFTTDIGGAEDSSGVIVNLQGQIIGIMMEQNYTYVQEDTISAVGITELKSVIEKITNGENSAYLGIYPVDVPSEIHTTTGMPNGAFVSKIDMDSPAMSEGIQSGDIVIGINGAEIESSVEYVSYLNRYKSGDTVTITLMRQFINEYKEVEVSIVLENRL